jgi:uncharacterized phage-associated protein
MHTAITVADEILKIAKSEGRMLTPLQLMKLVYISHGWHLAIRGQYLFGNRIEAWKYGPVIPDLYRATKQFGRNPIPLDLVDEVSSIDPETRAFLRDVYSKYGHLDGIALSSLTHQSGTPWDQVYEDGVLNLEISDDLIRNYYLALLHERTTRTSSAA